MNMNLYSIAVSMTKLLPRHIAEEWLDKVQRAKAEPRRFVTIGDTNFAISKIESYRYDKTTKTFHWTVCGKQLDLYVVASSQEGSVDGIIAAIEAYEGAAS